MTFWGIITLLLIGLVAGAIARLIIPGRQAIGLAMTVCLGIVGSFIGGMISYAIAGGGELLQTSNLLWSILGATLLLALAEMFTNRRVGAS